MYSVALCHRMPRLVAHTNLPFLLNKMHKAYCFDRRTKRQAIEMVSTKGKAVLVKGLVFRLAVPIEVFKLVCGEVEIERSCLCEWG